MQKILISELSKPNFGALGIFRLAHLIWGLDTPPRLTMLRVGTQWSEEQTSGRTALSDHLYHVISSHKHFWWARVGQSWPALAGVRLVAKPKDLVSEYAQLTILSRMGVILH